MGRRSLCRCRRPTKLKESPGTAAAEVAVAGEEEEAAHRKPLLPPTRHRTTGRRFRRACDELR